MFLKGVMPAGPHKLNPAVEKHGCPWGHLRTLAALDLLQSQATSSFKSNPILYSHLISARRHVLAGKRGGVSFSSSQGALLPSRPACHNDMLLHVNFGAWLH